MELTNSFLNCTGYIHTSDFSLPNCTDIIPFPLKYIGISKLSKASIMVLACLLYRLSGNLRLSLYWLALGLALVLVGILRRG